MPVDPPGIDSSQPPDAVRGRGTAENPPNRFERLHVVRTEWDEPEDPTPETELLRDSSRSILARNDSPDLPFDVSVNPYRGCSHGCPYCYARPNHEYLGFSAGLDFETKIVVKEDAPELLREALASPGWEPRTLMMSGVTDPYQPVERRLEITRGCLEVLAACRNPVSLITKNRMVTRDADLLGELARHGAALVTLSITTLRDDLHRAMEPRTSAPRLRLEAVRELSEAGIPVGVNVAPVIPGLTEHEVPAILEAAAEAGAMRAGYIPLRLPYGVAALFASWLERHVPDRKEKVLNRIRELRGGRLNDPRFGSRMKGKGRHAELISDLFHTARRRVGLDSDPPELSTDAFRRPALDGQMSLFVGSEASRGGEEGDGYEERGGYDGRSRGEGGNGDHGA